MRSKNSVARAASERGQALLETAMVLPIILLVSVGIFEFGRVYQTVQILTNAAREGARLAVLPNATPADVQARVSTYLTAGQLKNQDGVTLGRSERDDRPGGLIGNGVPGHGELSLLVHGAEPGGEAGGTRDNAWPESDHVDVFGGNAERGTVVMATTHATPKGRFHRLLADERGMSFVFVGMSMMAFMAASMLAIDVGRLMTARTQAQRSADAGALAGATALVFNSFTDRSATGPAVTGAVNTARANLVMSQQPSIGSADVTFPVNPDTGQSDLVEVTVYRSSVGTIRSPT